MVWSHAYSEEDANSAFHQYTSEMRVGRRHYWIRDKNNSELKLELIFYKDKLWCFGHAELIYLVPQLSALMDTMQESVKSLLDILSNGADPLEMLVHCPSCLGRPVDSFQKSPMTSKLSEVYFFNCKELDALRGGENHMVRCANGCSIHSAEDLLDQPVDIIKNEAKVFSNKLPLETSDIGDAVTVISFFLYCTDRAVLSGAMQDNEKCPLACDSSEQVQSINRSQLKKWWRIEKKPKRSSNVIKVSRHLINNFVEIETLSGYPAPAIQECGRDPFTDHEKRYLYEVAERIKRDVVAAHVFLKAKHSLNSHKIPKFCRDGDNYNKTGTIKKILNEDHMVWARPLFETS